MTYRLTLKEELAAMNSERARLERLYTMTVRFRTDALEWVSHPATDLPPEIVGAIFRAYVKSSAYRTVIDDAEAGEVAW